MESGDEPPRVKFLCSFGGGVFPRPLDGQLRYVGGETRIVSVPRGIFYKELTARMRELFEGVAAIKYQQPDEDLDALVSVLNDDDVTNMMEEYDKLGVAADGFTHLRIFLFSETELNAAHVDADERQTEWRYVDALNSLADTKPLPDGTEQFFGPPGVQASAHTHLQHLTIPNPLRYSDTEAPWSSVCYSPSSPSSSRNQFGVSGEFSDRISLEEYARQPPQYDHQSYIENCGFPNNLGSSHNVIEGSHICGNCRMAFQRSQPTVPDARFVDLRWKHGQPHIEHHQLNHRFEDLRLCASGTGRAGEHYVVDANGMKLPYLKNHIYDGHSMSSNHVNPDDTPYVRPANDLRNEVLHAQQMVGAAPHVHIPGLEDTGARYGNASDNVYPIQHNLPPIQPSRVNPLLTLHPGPSYESGLTTSNGANSRYFRLGVDEQMQNPWAAQDVRASQKIFCLDGSPPKNLHDHGSRVKSYAIGQNGQLRVARDSVPCTPGILHVGVPGEVVHRAPSSSCLDDNKVVAASVDHLSLTIGTHKIEDGAVKEPDVSMNPSLKVEIEEFDSKVSRFTEEEGVATLVADSDTGLTYEHGNISVEGLNFLPEMVASIKMAAMEGGEEVKAQAEANAGSDIQPVAEKKDLSPHELEHVNANVEVDADSENEHPPGIEPTTAEAEALDKGLQTIKNADLEEIRGLGSGAYGSVYHGKWKGSDVAIKRIKASCFAGKPSERARLIADFWKEALILSSLHHPNVVSFYGIVRDGPDGTLATVTEFMVNGSLKQFLQKKDRTIDRRKRLLLAMDAAFGMEYLHTKNIVHFDLKCENLLVNMRDPHRPICKIGDLGLSKVKQHTLVSGGVRGTLPWMAPELLSGKSKMVTEKIDVYSFGIVMWELLTGEDPYADMHCASIIGGMVNNTLRPQIPTWCDPQWKPLMESCWSADPGERPSFSEISQKLRNMSMAVNVK